MPEIRKGNFARDLKFMKLSADWPEDVRLIMRKVGTVLSKSCKLKPVLDALAPAKTPVI